MCNKICNNRRANLFSLICDNKYFMENVWNVPPWVIHSLFYFIHKNTLHKHNTYIHSSSIIYYLFFWSSSYTSTISDQTKTNTHLHHSFLMNTNSNLEKSDKNQNSSKQSCCTKYREREREKMHQYKVHNDQKYNVWMKEKSVHHSDYERFHLKWCWWRWQKGQEALDKRYTHSSSLI